MRVRMLGVLVLAGCASNPVEIRNLEASRQLEREARMPGSVAAGWRVFQDRCARCHGPDATGGEPGPDILPVVRMLGPRQFAATLLKRYQWILPPGQEWDAERRTTAMPDWTIDPQVTARMSDLYAYLAARAEGTQGSGAPRP